jgi:SAM-dependent methyltransferase
MTTPDWQPTSHCRACKHDALLPVFDFGDMPLADRLEDMPDSENPAPRAPLALLYCPTCTLVQLSVSVSPAFLFDDRYPYYSSVSPSLSAHFASSAERIIASHDVGPGSLVLEAASNDGYMLRHFKAAGADVLGFDPASGPATTAIRAGIDTRISFFDLEQARKLAAAGTRADVFLANNVLAHVPDLTGFAEAIACILKPDGIVVIEVPYLADLVLGNEFDTIYHQHLCYFTLTSLAKLFAMAGLRLDHAERISVHGGSLRLFVKRGTGTGVGAKTLIEREVAEGWNSYDFTCGIGDAAMRVRHGLRTLIDHIRSGGGQICAYGAAAKAATLLAWCRLDSDALDFICDLNPHKHGCYMPGTDLLIKPPDAIIAARPSHVLILAWNFANEIMQQLDEYHQVGGRFIIPIPDPVVVA